MQKGILTVLSGFSGAGKGTAMKRLMEKYEDYALSISATTRKPREGEVDGREYFFKETEEFEKMIAQDELIEYARYVNHYYGTPRSYVEEQLEKGKDVILEIEIQGALKVKEKFPDTLLVFVTPPSAEELRRRLIGRGTETMEVIEERLARAKEEARGIDCYDCLIINDDLETCVDELHAVIQNEKKKVMRNAEFIAKIRIVKKNRKENEAMLHPSYTDLMKVVNQDVEEGDTKIVNSRYSIVLATAKRARQLIDHADPLVSVKDGEKPLSIAIDEMNNGKLKILGEETEE